MSVAEEEQLYFVHGTTTALWRIGGTIDPARGGGDFGAGFYTFADTSWARQMACAWARRKALSDGGAPILVRVRIERSLFAALDREEISDQALDTAYTLYAERAVTGKEVVVGPVGRNGPDGRRVAEKRLPLQYKFEGRGIALLVFDSVIPC